MDIAETVTLAGAAATAASELLAIAPRNISQTGAWPTAAPGSGRGPPHRYLSLPLRHQYRRSARPGGPDPRLRQLPGVVHVEEKLFACSLESTKQLAAVIHSKNLNRLVVAACTPTHPRTGLSGGRELCRPEPGVCHHGQCQGAMRLGPPGRESSRPGQSQAPYLHGRGPGLPPAPHSPPKLSHSPQCPDPGRRRRRFDRLPEPGRPGFPVLSHRTAGVFRGGGPKPPFHPGRP